MGFQCTSALESNRGRLKYTKNIGYRNYEITAMSFGRSLIGIIFRDSLI